MQVTSVDCYPVELPLRAPFETNFGRFSSRRILIVAVTADGQVAGAECPVFGPYYSYETLETARAIIEQYIAPSILGEELSVPEDYAERLKFLRGHPFARCAVEQALWELWAREKESPTWQLAGGLPEPVRCQLSIGVKNSPAELLEAVQEGIEQGYAQIKIKIRKGWDLQVLEAVRESFPDVPLMVDANAGYTLNDMTLLKQLDSYGLEMIEQPLHHADLHQHGLLQQELSTPICLDESIESLQDLDAAIALRSCQIVNIKLSRVGGLAAAREMAHCCQAHGLGVWCGGMVETGLGNAANLVAASLPEFNYPNDITPSYTYFDEEIVSPPLVLSEDGTLPLTDRPGSGQEILWDVIRHYAVE